MSRYLKEELQALRAYTPGEQPQDQAYIKLNTNESPYPPAPSVAAAITRQEVEQLRLYSDPTGAELKGKLAGLYGVEPENVFLSNGSDEVLNFAFLAFGAEGVAYPDISYGFYPVFAQLYQLDAVEIPLKEDFTVDYRDYCGIGRMVVLANPNAPTGRSIPVTEIRQICQTNPDHVVLIDEAYVDFGGETALPLVKEFDNLLVTRTFSKSRCLAGGRLGYAFGSRALIEDLEKIKYSTNPYNLDRLTLRLGVATVEAEDYYLRAFASRPKKCAFCLQGHANTKPPPGVPGRGQRQRLLQQLFAGIGGAFQILAAVGLDQPCVRQTSQLRVDGALGQHRQVMLGGYLIHMAFAKDLDLLAAVRAEDIAHILYDAQHGYLHHLGHVHSLGYDHAHQLLGAGDHNDAVYRQALEHGQRHVAGARGHIHEQEVHVLPDHVGPELLDCAGNDRAAPDHGIFLVFHQQVDAHHINAHPALDRPAALVVCHSTAVDAEQLGDGRAGDIGVQHAAVIAAASHCAGQQSAGHAFAHAALAGHNADHLANAAVRVGGVMLRGLAGRAGCPAMGAVMSAFFAHSLVAHRSPGGGSMRFPPCIF